MKEWHSTNGRCRLPSSPRREVNSRGRSCTARHDACLGRVGVPCVRKRHRSDPLRPSTPGSSGHTAAPSRSMRGILLETAARRCCQVSEAARERPRRHWLCCDNIHCSVRGRRSHPLEPAGPFRKRAATLLDGTRPLSDSDTNRNVQCYDR